MVTIQSSPHSQKNSLTSQHNLDFEKKNSTSRSSQLKVPAWGGGVTGEAPPLAEAVDGWYWQVLQGPVMN